MYNELTDEDIYEDLFTSKSEDDNFEILIEVAKVVKGNSEIKIYEINYVIDYLLGDSTQKPEIYEKYLRGKQTKKFKI